MDDMKADILPCASCGGDSQTMEVSKPEGRTADVYRVICSCGAASAMWSVTPHGGCAFVEQVYGRAQQGLKQAHNVKTSGQKTGREMFTRVLRVAFMQFLS